MVHEGMKIQAPHPHQVRSAREFGRMRLVQTRELVEEIFEDEGLHALQVLSLGNAVAGTLSAARAGIRAIGVAYAELSGIDEKHAAKQVDRLLSNSALRVDELSAAWTRYVVGDAKDIVVALDWTDFAEDDHTTLYIALVTTKGRALPLLWKTLQKSKLKGQQTATELKLLQDLHATLDVDVNITVLADRGFAKADIYETLGVLGIDYVIRLKRDMVVSDAEGRRFVAQDLVPTNGRVHAISNARVTAENRMVPQFVCVKAKAMKEPWCLISSLSERKPQEIVALYGRRFTVEETFRDTKNLNFGLGLAATHIRVPERRDRMLLLIAMAQGLLTLLGEASERSGMDRYLKINTVKTRTMSLINQGTRWWRKLHNLRDERRIPLLTAYDELLREHGFFARALGLSSDFSAAK